MRNGELVHTVVLTESLTIITPLNVIKENADSTAQNDEERFDGDFLLMAGELNRILSEIVAALDGELRRCE